MTSASKIIFLVVVTYTSKNTLLECFKHVFTAKNTLKFNLRGLELVFKMFSGGHAPDSKFSMPSLYFVFTTVWPPNHEVLATPMLHCIIHNVQVCVVRVRASMCTRCHCCDSVCANMHVQMYLV